MPTLKEIIFNNRAKEASRLSAAEIDIRTVIECPHREIETVGLWPNIIHESYCSHPNRITGKSANLECKVRRTEKLCSCKIFNPTKEG